MTNFVVKSKIKFPPIEIKPPSSKDQIQLQQNEGCGRHALNNLFRNPNTSSQENALFIKGTINDKIDLYQERPETGISLFGICSLIHKNKPNNCLENENYDISVLHFALLYAGYDVDIPDNNVLYPLKDNQNNKNKMVMNVVSDIQNGILKGNKFIGGIVNYGGGHWVSIVILDQNQLHVYDSIGSKGSKTEYNKLSDYLNDKTNIEQILFIKHPDSNNTTNTLLEYKNFGKNPTIKEIINQLLDTTEKNETKNVEKGEEKAIDNIVNVTGETEVVKVTGKKEEEKGVTIEEKQNGETVQVKEETEVVKVTGKKEEEKGVTIEEKQNGETVQVKEETIINKIMNQLNKIIYEVLNLDKKGDKTGDKKDNNTSISRPNNISTQTDNDKSESKEETKPNEIEAASGKVIIKETDIEGKSSKIVKIEEIKM
jgi:hypothetical protein